MTDDIFESLNVYSSNEVAAILNVKDSTLRKYAGILEENGYTFLKNSQGHRGYFDKDLIVLKKITEFKKHPDMTLKQACIAVIAWNRERDVAATDTEGITGSEQYSGRLLEEFKEFKQQQENFNRELIQQLKNQLQSQQEYIDDSLNRRDRILMEAIRESQKNKMMLAAAQEVEPEAEPEVVQEKNTVQENDQKTQEAVQEAEKKKSWIYFWKK